MLLLTQYTKVVHTTDNLTDMYEENLIGSLQSGRTKREKSKAPELKQKIRYAGGNRQSICFIDCEGGLLETKTPTSQPKHPGWLSWATG